MDTLSRLLCLPSFLRLVTEHLQVEQHQIVLTIASTQKSVPCPECHFPSPKIHSHYERTVADISLAEYRVIWKLWVRKFFCRNRACHKRIFSERMPEIVAPWARKTNRLNDRLTSIALALAGRAGKRLSLRLDLSTSRSTLVRLIHRLPLPIISTPKVLGVDDWAFRRGRNYGTILVDLQKRKPIALLADREAETLARWLSEHPGVEVITRDRSKAYRQGARKGAPNAIQVCDRFHLILNLAEALEKVCTQHNRELKIVEQSSTPTTLNSSQSPETVTVPPPSREKTAQSQAQSNRARRLAKFEQVWRLYRQGLSQRAIARQVGISVRTVQRFLQTPVFPEHQRRSDRGRTLLEPYIPYLLERWNSGCLQGRQLFAELVVRGYPGSYMTLARYVHRLREAQGLSPRQRRRGRSSPEVVAPQQPPLTPRRVAALVLCRAERQDRDDALLIKRLQSQHSELATAITLTQDFAQIVRERLPALLDSWIQQALHSSLSSFVSYAQGLVDDYAAVRAGVSVDWSNGQVEGQINRLKMLKRQMYGRASLPLLRRRFLLAC